MEENSKASIFNRERILLELSVFFYFIAKNSIIPLAQQYVYVLVARKYNFTGMGAGSSETCVSPWQDEHEAQMRHMVNEESSLIVLYLNVAELLPTCFIVLFLGCWSDATGRRKFLMWLPCLGNAIYALGFIIPTYVYGGEFTAGGAAIVVTSTIIAGLSGNLHGFMAGNACYISDTDSMSRRTLRLAIVECIIGFTFGVSNLGLGYWIQSHGFVPALWFVFACSVVPLILLTIFIPEPETASRDRNPTLQDFKLLRHICGCATLSQRKLWAMFFAFIIYVFVQQGQERTHILYLENYPLCWDSVKMGMFMFFLYFLSGLGSWPGVPLLNKVVGDLPIFFIGILSKAIGSLVLAFAKNDTTVYIACVLQIFHLTPFAVGRSLVSQQVGLDEQGTVYGLLHSAQALAGFLGPLLLNAMFFGTMMYLNGATFLISGGLLLFSVMLLGWWVYMEKKEDSYSAVDTHSLAQSDSEMLTPASETSGLMQR